MVDIVFQKARFVLKNYLYSGELISFSVFLSLFMIEGTLSDSLGNL